MKVLITAATALELSEIEKRTNPNNEVELVYCITGVGAIPTLYTLMDVLQKGKFDRLIQLGIAGSFDTQIELGSAVVVEKDFLAEMGVTENNQYNDVFAMGLADANAKPFTNGALVNTNLDWMDNSSLKRVCAVTNNEISTTDNKINLYRNQYGADIETMEGGAFHYASIMQAIPFVQLRGISNYVGDRNKDNWKIKDAIVSYSDACMELIEHLTKNK